MTKKALITGIGGQDGGYLSELLLGHGYEITGIARDSGSVAGSTGVQVMECDIADNAALLHIIRRVQPDEIYNLAAQSQVGVSFQDPASTVATAGVGAVNLFEAVRLESPRSKVFQASSSEMFGNSADADGFQRETTPMLPLSPYAFSKVFAFRTAQSYRSAYGLYISNGILFNHESPRRKATFVTSKICREAVRIKHGLAEKLEIGDTDVRRDWGHSKDCVRAMWMMLQLDEPDDFVCSTGIDHSVGDIIEYVFRRLQLDVVEHVRVNPDLLRKSELRASKGDSRKLRNMTGWEPGYTFESMLDELIDHWEQQITRG